MESHENVGDETDGQKGPNSGVPDLTFTLDNESTINYCKIENQESAFFNLFLKERLKDDVRGANNSEENSSVLYSIVKTDHEIKTTHFVVAESCKEDTKIDCDYLYGNGQFSLTQYFQMYCKLKKENTYKIQIVVWTNAEFDNEDLEQHEVKLKQILDYQESSIPMPADFKKKPGKVYQIEDLPTNILIEERSSISETDDDEKVKEFCDNLIFFITPKDKLLNAMAVIGIKRKRPEMKLEKGDFFKRTDDIEGINKITDSNISVLHCTSASTSLTFIKIAQLLKNRAPIIYYSAVELDYLLSYKDEIAAVLELADIFVLAVEIPKKLLQNSDWMNDHEEDIVKVLDTCIQLCQKNPTCLKIILIYNTENQDVVNLWIKDETHRANENNLTEFKFTIDQLTEEAQQRMREKKVKFQGQDVPLQELLGAESPSQYNNLLTQNVLDKQISSEPLVMGNPLPGLSPEVKECYIERDYEHSNEHLGNSNSTPNESEKETSLNVPSRGKNIPGSEKLKFGRRPSKKYKTKWISMESNKFVEKAHEMKKVKPDHSFIYVDLEEHITTLDVGALSTVNDVTNFLIIAGRPIKDVELEKNKLCKLLQEGSKIIVFLDAFGEWCLEWMAKVVALVDAMKGTMIKQIWINTKKHNRNLFKKDCAVVSAGNEPHEKAHSTSDSTSTDNNKHRFTWENPDEGLVIENIEADKLVVISGEPGTGKSVMLSKIAINIKETYPDYWVIQLCLRDHTELLSKINLQIQIDDGLIDFLARAEGVVDFTHIGKAILTNRVWNSGKIVVLLDGLDEVYPLYKQKIDTLIKSMNSSNIKQIWITTRPEFKNVFKTEHLYTLKDFKSDDQDRFLKKYSRYLLQLNQKEMEENDADNSEGIETRLVEVHNKIKNSNVKTRLIGNALLARMTVEVFCNEIEEFRKPNPAGKESSVVDVNIPTKVNQVNSLSRLYDLYLEQRYRFHCEGKWKASTSSAILNMENKKKLFNTAYQRYAFEFLLKDNFDLFYVSEDKLAEILKWDLIGIGIMSEMWGNISFFHRTFAEHFVAQFLAEILTGKELVKLENDTTMKAANTPKIKFLTLEPFKYKFQMIRHFMDYMLSHGSEIHEAVLNDDYVAFQRLLQRDKGLKSKRDKLGRTPLHLACSYKRKKMADDLLKLDESLIADLDKLGFGPVCYAAIKGDEFFTKKLIIAGANYNKGDYKHLRNFMQIYNLK